MFFRDAVRWIVDYNAWRHRVVGTPTGGLVFAGSFGLGASLDEPLLIGTLLDGLLPLGHFLGNSIGIIAMMYGGVTLYGLYTRVPFHDE